MWKKVISIIILITIIAFCVSSCSSGNDTKIETKKTGTEATNPNALKIYHLHRQRYLISAVSTFKSLYPDVEIDETIYQPEQTEEMRNKITTETLAGEGPDIIAFDDEYFPFTSKYLYNGVLYDLNELIEKDSQFFDEDKYNQIVINKGVADGGRYVIPLAYKLPMFYTVKSALDNDGITTDVSNWTWDEMIDTVKKFKEKNKGNRKYFFNYWLAFPEIVKYSGTSFVDVEHKKAKFDSSEFIKLLEDYKEIYPAICPADINTKYRGNVYNMIKDGIIKMVYSDDLVSLYELIAINSECKYFLGEDALVSVMPPVSGGQYGVPQAVNFVGIAAKCKKPMDAFNFIKILLSDNFQKKNEENLGSTNDSSAYRGAAVNINVFKKEAEYFMSGEADSHGRLVGDVFKGFSDINDFINFPLYKMPQKLVDSIYEMISNVKSCTLPEQAINDFIATEVEDFISGKKSAVQTAKAINDKVNIYLNE